MLSLHADYILFGVNMRQTLFIKAAATLLTFLPAMAVADPVFNIGNASVTIAETGPVACRW